MWPPKTILHPSDFSDNARHALDIACQIARAHDAKVVVLHAFSPSVLAIGEVPPVMHEVENEEEIERQLSQIQSSIPDVKIEYKAVNGHATETIVDAAQSMHADLIVMGTFGRTGFRRFFLGSVADHVLRRAPCPVLVVPLSK